MGMGHVFRSLALAEAFAAAGHDPAQFFCNEDASSLRAIRDRGYEVTSYALSDGSDTWMNVDDGLSVPDAVVVDVPEPIPGALEALKRCWPAVRIVALDYFDMEEQNVDAIVNLFNHHETLKRPTGSHVDYYEGPSYAIIREPFRSFFDRPRPALERVENLLVTFGGADMQGHTLKVLEVLKAVADKHLTCHVVIGPNFKDVDEIERMANDLPMPCEIHRSVQNMEELMFQCDLGIHGSGTTLLEMASLGRPSIVIPQNDNEFRFANWFRERGAVVSLGHASELNTEKIKKALDALLPDREKRQRMSGAIHALVDGHGRERIVALVEECLVRKG